MQNLHETHRNVAYRFQNSVSCVSYLTRVLVHMLIVGQVLTCSLLFQDQYAFCYRSALEYLGSFDHYAN